MRILRLIAISLVLFCFAGVALADSPPLAFGPEPFEVTDDGVAEYLAPFAVDNGGPYVLFLRNGSEETGRVDEAAVRINGVLVVQGGELSADREGLSRPVQLNAGENELSLELQGPPGSFVTLAIARPGHHPVLIHGRLLLPWGRDDGAASLSIALKNGSPHYPRAARVVLLHPDGQVAAATGKIAIPPRGSLTLPLAELPGADAWEAGSIEVFFAGRGVSRLFGSARQVDSELGQAELQPLEQAGIRVFKSHPRASRR